jgi:hypothetical protein
MARQFRTWLVAGLLVMVVPAVSFAGSEEVPRLTFAQLVDAIRADWGFPVKPEYTRKAFGFLGLPLHVDFIWNRGAYIMEILNLDDLAKDRAYEFFFVLGPLLLKGGIGVPINPVALL